MTNKQQRILLNQVWRKKIEVILLAIILSLLIRINLPLHGQDIDGKELVRTGNINAVKKWLDADPKRLNGVFDSYGWTPLLHAVDAGRLNTVRLLLKRGADLNKRSNTGWSPLTRSVEANRKEICNFLLTLNPKFPEGQKAYIRFLHKAAAGGFKALTLHLIRNGIHIESKNRIGNSLLHSAAIGGLDSVCLYLIKNGMDPNRLNHYQMTALHFASIYGKERIAKILVDQGARLDLSTELGQTATDLAKRHGHTKLVGILKGLGKQGIPFRFPVLKGAYLGQERPDKKARRFAPGIIATYLEEHSIPVFSKDGKSVFWSVRNIYDTNHSLRMMRRTKGRWSAPEKIAVTEGFSNANPVIHHPTGRVIFGSSIRPDDDRTKNQGGLNLLVIRPKDGGWEKPAYLDPILNSSTDNGASFARNGNLYYNSGRKGGFGLNDLYISEFRNNRYSKPRNLGSVLNTASFDCYPYVAPDESYLIFEAYRPANIGRGDLYISFRDSDGRWQKPVNMGPKINSREGRESFPQLSPDGKYFFFSSDRLGSLDAYWIDASVIDEIRNDFLKKEMQQK